MKKKTKKLVLAKDTVRNLEKVDLKYVAGGFQNPHQSDTECPDGSRNC